MTYEYQILCTSDGTTWWTTIPERCANSKYAAKKYAQKQIDLFNKSASKYDQRELVAVRASESGDCGSSPQ